MSTINTSEELNRRRFIRAAAITVAAAGSFGSLEP
jgi:hypothetical protein